jgi:hypothetical protein
MIVFDSGFVEYNNRKIHQLLLVEFFDDFDEELFYDDLEAFFPKHLVRDQREKCAKVLRDLYYWSDDEFKHKLTPFHEVGLYNFLEYINNYRKDDPQLFDHIYYDEDDEKEVRKIWHKLDKEEWSTINELRLYLKDINNMVEDCFEDIDFITFPYLLGNVVDKESELAPHSLIDFYDELLPEDIRQEYDSLRKNIKSNLTLFEQLSKVLGVISHGVQYRGWHKLFWNGSQPKSETEVHICLDLLFDAYFGEAKVDVSREVDTGTGKIDFKFYANSNERVPIEVKLGSSSKIKQGFEKQIVHYMNATECTNAYYVIVCFTNDELAKAKELVKGLQPSKGKVIEIVILDVTLKKSASRL